MARYSSRRGWGAPSPRSATIRTGAGFRSMSSLRGSSEHRVGTLPLPLSPAEIVALGGQDRPHLLEDAGFDPPPEPVVGHALGAVPPGELVPPAAVAHPEDDPVEHRPGDPPT